MIRNYKLNGRVINNPTIEQYNNDTKKWEPYSSSDSKYSLHTTPYVKFDQYTAIIGKGVKYHPPVNGMAQIFISWNPVIELDCNLTLNIYNKNGDKTKTINRNSAIIGLRPETSTIDIVGLSEVEKDGSIEIVTAGVGGGIVFVFMKIDTTYRIEE